MRKYQKFLDTEFECMDFNKPTTPRKYFTELLLTLWEEGESFSGKRPFGNSGWYYDLFRVLVEHNFVPGKLDEDNNVLEIDDTKAHDFIVQSIKELTK